MGASPARGRVLTSRDRPPPKGENVSAPTAGPARRPGVFSPGRAPDSATQPCVPTGGGKSPLVVDLGFRGRSLIYATVRGVPSETTTTFAQVPLPDGRSTPRASARGCTPEASHFWPQIIPRTCGGFRSPALSLPFLLPVPADLLLLPRGPTTGRCGSPQRRAQLRSPTRNTTGETRFPLIVQNTHRYFFYIAGIISVINTYDAIVAFHSDKGPGGFGFGLGNVISRHQCGDACGSTRCRCHFLPPTSFGRPPSKHFLQNNPVPLLAPGRQVKPP